MPLPGRVTVSDRKSMKSVFVTAFKGVARTATQRKPSGARGLARLASKLRSRAEALVAAHDLGDHGPMRLVPVSVLCACLASASCGGDEFSPKNAAGAGGSAGATSAGGSAGKGAGGATAGAGGSSAGAAGSLAGAGGTAGAGGSSAGSAGAGGSDGGAAGSTATCHVPSSAKPVPAGTEEVLAVTDDPQPEYPVVDATHVYWTTDTTLWRIDKAGSCLQQLAIGGTQLENVVVDGGYAYVADTDAGKAYRVPIAGGAFETIVSGQGPMPTIAVDDTDIYWCRAGSGVARRAKDGSGNMQIIGTADPINHCFAIAVDASHVFVATSTGVLVRANKEMGSPLTQLDSATAAVEAKDPVFIGLYANRVYWTHWLNGPDSGGVRSVTTDGQGLASIVETHPESFATDGASAYWTIPYSPGGSIRKGYAALTTASDLVKNQQKPCGVAIDASHVYWVNYNDRTLRRALR
jgi:hypothetical protein